MQETDVKAALIVWAALLAFATASTAQEVLSLGNAVALALEANPRIEASAAGRDVAQAELAGARAARWPRLEVTAGVQRTDQPALVFGQRLAQERFAAEDFAIDRLNDPDPSTDWVTRIDVAQPLWTGGRTVAATAMARASSSATGRHHDALRRAVARDAVQTWTGLVVARRGIAVARQALDTAAAHSALVADLFAAGLVVEADVFQARARQAELAGALARAESDEVSATEALLFVLGQPSGSRVDVPDQLPDPPEIEGLGLSLDLVAIHEEALARRPDVQAARDEVAAARAGLELERARGRPSVGVSGSFEAHDADFGVNDGQHWTVGLAARLPLFDRGRRARVAAAEAAVRRATAALRSAEGRVGLELRSSLARTRAADARQLESGAAVELAEQALKIVEDRVREGLTTLPELRDAETALTSARLRELASAADRLLAATDFELATGAFPAAGESESQLPEGDPR